MSHRQNNGEVDFDISICIADFLAGTISVENDVVLKLWLREPENKVLFEKICSKESMRRHVMQYQNEDVNKAFQSFVDKRLKKERQLRIRRWMLAASLILPFITVSYLMWTTYSNPTEIKEHSGLAVVENKKGQPRLTLSNSSQISLSDTTILGQIDGSSIVIGEGEIDYSRVNNEEGEGIYHKLEIPTACTYHMILSDGTKVWLNAQSYLRYPVKFAKNERIVEVSGEAYFEVNSDVKRPFYVVTDGMKVKVTGTSFNVSQYSYDKFAQVTLVKGSVSVHLDNTEYKLTPGRQLYWNKESGNALVKNVNTAEFTSWKNGVYSFKSRRLDEVLRVAERWYDIEFVFQNDYPRSVIYTGIMLKQDSLEEFLKRLEATSNLSFKRNGSKVNVSTR